MPSAGERGQDVGKHLLVASVVGDEVPVDGGHPARSRRVRVAAVDEVRQMGGEGPLRCATGRGGSERARLRGGHGVPDRARPAARSDRRARRGGTESRSARATAGPGSDAPRSRTPRREVMTLVDHHEAVSGGQLRQVVAPRQGLQGHHVDRAAQLRAATTELARGNAEVFGQPRPPLIGEGLAVDQHQRRGGVSGDQRARDHGLARPGRRDQHPMVMIGEVGDGVGLVVAQRRGEHELTGRTNYDLDDPADATVLYERVLVEAVRAQDVIRLINADRLATLVRFVPPGAGSPALGVPLPRPERRGMSWRPLRR